MPCCTGIVFYRGIVLEVGMEATRSSTICGYSYTMQGVGHRIEFHSVTIMMPRLFGQALTVASPVPGFRPCVFAVPGWLHRHAPRPGRREAARKKQQEKVLQGMRMQQLAVERREVFNQSTPKLRLRQGAADNSRELDRMGKDGFSESSPGSNNEKPPQGLYFIFFAHPPLG